MAQKSAKPPGESVPPPLPGSADRAPPPLPSERLAPPPLPKVLVDGLDPETLPGRPLTTSEVSIEVDTADLEPPSMGGAHSIDKLLALTTESWDVDDQVRTLKAASIDPRAHAAAESSRPKGPALAMPTPYDIGAKGGPGSSPGIPPALDASPSAPSLSPASRPPPPLPNRASTGPPPLPGRPEF